MKLQNLICPNCKGELNIEDVEKNAVISCPYCREKLYFDAEKNEYTYTKNVNINKIYTDEAEVLRTKMEAESEKNSMKYALIWLMLLIVLPLLLYVPSFFARMNGKINAGSYKELVGKDYKTVEAHFKSAGFTDVELIDLDDSGLIFWNEGKVDTISVGGKTNFDSDDWFDKNTKVVISYH